MRQSYYAAFVHLCLECIFCLNCTELIGRDQLLTLEQNYRRLGLTSKLNARTGGIETLASHVLNLTGSSPCHQDRLTVVSKLPITLAPAEARVERDAKSGAILRVIRASVERFNPLNDPLNDVLDGARDNPQMNYVSGGIIKELEEQASLEIQQRPRRQSQREEEWIENLVEKYGDNYSRMTRDRKLNPYQQREGDLRRRVERWTKKGRGHPI